MSERCTLDAYSRATQATRVYIGPTVFDAALDRIRFLFREFEHLIVNISGGKDSTVIFFLCQMVAEEMGRLPIRVLWLDQEAEWQGTVDTCKDILLRPDVIPMWYQMPMVITNNASAYERYNYCWKPEDRDRWIHPQHPVSVKENHYGTDRFHDLFEEIIRTDIPNAKAAHIGGVRAEESPRRLLAMIDKTTYKGHSWGKKYAARDDKPGEYYTFYPIYDWTWKDIWKAIHDNGWPYNPIYDAMYRYGIPTQRMRISSLHHETAVISLTYAQEMEPETWNRICERIPGANTVSHLNQGAFSCPDHVPYMFSGWEEYALFLIERMVQEEHNRTKLLRTLEAWGKVFTHKAVREDMYRAAIATVLTSDWDHTHMANFYRSPQAYNYRKWKQGDILKTRCATNKYIPEEARRRIKAELKEERRKEGEARERNRRKEGT